MLQVGFPGVMPAPPPGRKVLFVPVQYGTAGLGLKGIHVAATLNATNFGYANFEFPPDMGELLTFELIAIEFGSGSDWTVLAEYGKDGELRNTHSVSTVVAVPTGGGLLRAVDIKSLFEQVGEEAEAGDIVGTKLNSDFIDYFIGFRYSYLPA